MSSNGRLGDIGEGIKDGINTGLKIGETNMANSSLTPTIDPRRNVSVEKEVLYDKEISLVSQSGEKPGQLVAELSQDDYTVHITSGSLSWSATSWNFFTALSSVREVLEDHSLKPAVEGACVDVYPSRMALEMGGGRRAYRWPGTGSPMTVDIFDDVPLADRARLASVAEQQRAHERRRGHGDG
ncbi:hypothetical protein [Streptomyces sp. SA15]|uniref:hypothetical protein n=1 Tax=Streptomyces sp. SA15 TaxID=934019 RepID=UPI0011810234|nr:hypothetical protein [Streptomyces sp. SA15]